ncbi:peptidase M28-like protein [Arcicella aurantiaca]|uniref:Peptidase M28-like protein n=1 Tax=Arcicella aurantiaca TaxID=591202 RepID=A0A316EJ87_9BACT|nr:M28 family peptidase [Arcicella aurantiaca]PWK23020.1 peptidase M28-like protein [Arcicella aurantiaca]
MKTQRISLIFLAIFVFSGVAVYFKSCQKPASTESAPVEDVAITLNPAPDFKADSAFAYVKAQVDFGPRVPNTKAHKACGDYLVAKLKQFGCEVISQDFVATKYDGTKMNARNIIGSINPSAPKRILLTAHWDSRSVADKDTKDKNSPIDGANDGGSGVGVLLELARTIQQATQKPNVGVDIIFFDVEDHGEPEDYKGEHKPESWGLGSQYWAAHKHKENYTAYYGILLDMVGGKGAVFPHEGTSMQYAPMIVRNIWDIASRLGYSTTFIDADGGGLTDDHTAVNDVGKIQMIDIVELHPNSPETFWKYHHTHGDNLSNIDKNTLKAVGQTVLSTLYQE